MNPTAPSTVELTTKVEGIDVAQLSKVKELVGAVQPVWIMVSVDRDVRPGKYNRYSHHHAG